MSTACDTSLRVALLTGTLGRGGAEKQLVYMARALRQVGISVRVYCLTRGEFYERALAQAGVSPIWVGRWANPMLRVGTLARALADFRPHIVQAIHFYTNLYVSTVAPLYRAISIGGIRNDTIHDVAANGGWGRWLLRMPGALIANSYRARANAELFGIDADSVRVVPNVVDLSAFDEASSRTGVLRRAEHEIVVAAVARHVPFKRLDRFLTALYFARAKMPSVRGVLIGDGPERQHLQTLAGNLGLLPDGARFLGSRDDVPDLLRRADMLLLTSDHEGSPNVILEAMAARRPVITTPAGDAGELVREGLTGYVVGFDDVREMAARIVRLARSPRLRKEMGESGRRRVEQHYSLDGLADSLLSSYRAVAERQGHRRVLELIPSCGAVETGPVDPQNVAVLRRLPPRRTTAKPQVKQ